MPKYKRTSGEEYNITQDQVEDFMSTYPDAVEITEEIQTDPTEGKTNGAVAKGATATPVTGQAPESSDLGLEDSSSGLNIEDFLVTVDDLKDNETNVVTNLNNKLSRLGLSCLLYTSPSPRDVEESRMPSSA